MGYFTGDWVYNTAKVLATPILLPASGLYALGGALNAATGGTTTTYDLGTALRGGSTGTTFSNAVLAPSFYDPGSREADGVLGGLQIPILNKYTGEAVKDAADAWPWLKWLPWIAGGVAAVALWRR